MHREPRRGGGLVNVQLPMPGPVARHAGRLLVALAGAAALAGCGGEVIPADEATVLVSE